MRLFSLINLIAFGVLTGLIGLVQVFELNTDGYSIFSRLISPLDEQIGLELIIHLPVALATCVFLVNASFVCFVARSVGAPLAHVFGTIALLLAYIKLGLEFGHHFTPGDFFENAYGRLLTSNEFFRAMGFSLTILGSAAMICGDKVYKIGAYAIGVMAGVSFAIYSYLFLTVDVFAAEIFLVVPCIGLLALYFIRTLDEDQSDLPHLTVGVAALVVSSFGIELFGSFQLQSYRAETNYTIEARNLSQNSFLIMTFFGALIIYAGQRISVLTQWIHASLLASGLVLTFIPALLRANANDDFTALEEVGNYAPMHPLTLFGVIITAACIIYGITKVIQSKAKGSYSSDFSASA